MSMYSQLYVLPFYESCAIFFNLISGILLLGEYKVYTGDTLVSIMFGCLVSVFGIMLKLQGLEAYD